MLALIANAGTTVAEHLQHVYGPLVSVGAFIGAVIGYFAAGSGERSGPVVLGIGLGAVSGAFVAGASLGL